VITLAEGARERVTGALVRPRTYVVAGVVVAIAIAFVALGLKQALVIGTIGGSAYGLLALGLVLVYKSSGIFNFAQAEFGTVAVYFLYILKGVLPYPLALLGALVVAIVMGLLVERLIVRPLFDAPRVTLLVATAGVALAAIGLEFWLGEPKLRAITPLLTRADRFAILGQRISDQQIFLVFTLLALGVLLALFFSRTNLGLAILGASQEPVATELVGISVRRLSSFTWGLAALLGGIAGVLFVPISGTFGPGAMTSGVLIPAFTAAVLGGMSSLPGAFLGGAIVGVAQAAAISYDGFKSVPGKGSVIVFLLLVIVLAVRPQGLLGSKT
jgi:branched-chain amino acid transport system permease protein